MAQPALKEVAQPKEPDWTRDVPIDSFLLAQNHPLGLSRSYAVGNPANFGKGAEGEIIEIVHMPNGGLRLKLALPMQSGQKEQRFGYVVIRGYVSAAAVVP